MKKTYIKPAVSMAASPRGGHGECAGKSGMGMCKVTFK